MGGIRAWWVKRKQRKNERDVERYEEKRGMLEESAMDHMLDENTVVKFRRPGPWGRR
jgi:hypothetical protein